MLNVELEGKSIQCEKGTTLYSLAKQFQKNYSYPIIVAKVDGVIQELYHSVVDNSKIKFCTIETEDGSRAYFRGMCMMLLKAVYREIPRKKIKKVTIDFSMHSAYYCTIDGDVVITKELLDAIEKRMLSYVDKNLIFEKSVIRTTDAKEMFEKHGMPEKGQLMDFRKNSRMTIYSLGKFTDYFYGAMPYSTEILKYFKLHAFEKGFCFVLPMRNNPTVVPEFEPDYKRYNALIYTNTWSKKLNCSTVGELNDIIVNGDFEQLMLTQEALHEKKIGDIAEMIEKKGCHVVTIAGPSSSGKTTFSYRLSTQLRTLGLNPHPIALDDYFVNRVDTPKDEFGKYDYECIEAIDTAQFNDDLTNLLAGKAVQLPTYNFISGEREYNKPLLKLKKDDILVIEGIHGLNDKLTYSIDEGEKFKVFISALTTLNLDIHNRIPENEGRLIRRIIRDARTRGHSAQKTISMWDSVRRGERKNIIPFQDKADVIFNSALIYELAAMKLYADPVLYQVPKECEEYSEAHRLLKFLDYFIPIDPHAVPLNSIIREFIGNGIILD